MCRAGSDTPPRGGGRGSDTPPRGGGGGGGGRGVWAVRVLGSGRRPYARRFANRCGSVRCFIRALHSCFLTSGISVCEIRLREVPRVSRPAIRMTKMAQSRLCIWRGVPVAHVEGMGAHGPPVHPVPAVSIGQFRRVILSFCNHLFRFRRAIASPFCMVSCRRIVLFPMSITAREWMGTRI